MSPQTRSDILTWLQSHVPESRIRHILRVEEMSADLARHHNVDPDKAAQAGPIPWRALRGRVPVVAVLPEREGVGRARQSEIGVGMALATPPSERYGRFSRVKLPIRASAHIRPCGPRTWPLHLAQPQWYCRYCTAFNLWRARQDSNLLPHA